MAEALIVASAIFLLWSAIMVVSVLLGFQSGRDTDNL
jgi:hypothetical protein